MHKACSTDGENKEAPPHLHWGSHSAKDPEAPSNSNTRHKSAGQLSKLTRSFAWRRLYVRMRRISPDRTLEE